MSGREKFHIGSILLLILLFCAWRAATGMKSGAKSGGLPQVPGSHGYPNEMVGVGSKHRIRPEAPPKPTHYPRELIRFYLPTMRMKGVGLNEGLAMIRSEYLETCAACGEVPLPLKFDVRHDVPLPDILLEAETVDQAVRLLAGLCGMEVGIRGVTYRLREIEDGSNITERLTVPKGAISYITRVLGGSGEDIGKALFDAGIVSTPGFAITVASSGEVTMDGGSGRDRAVLSSLLAVAGSSKQIKFRVTVREATAPHGFDLQIPESGVISHAESRILLDKLKQGGEPNIFTLPSITSSAGKMEEYKITSEVILPNDGAESGSSIYEYGKVVSFTPSPLGFGSKVNLLYQNTDLTEEENGLQRIRPIASVSSYEYVRDGMTKVIISEKTDGSMHITLLTTNMLDATGLLLSESPDWKDSFVE